MVDNKGQIETLDNLVEWSISDFENAWRTDGHRLEYHAKCVVDSVSKKEIWSKLTKKQQQYFLRRIKKVQREICNFSEFLKKFVGEH